MTHNMWLPEETPPPATDWLPTGYDKPDVWDTSDRFVFRRPAWQAQAACRGQDPNNFYPEKGGHTTLANAKRVCAGCPVKAECLEFGLKERFGVWGGLSERERRKLRRARSGAPPGTPGRWFKEAQCGTPLGFKRHKDRREEPCEACRAAKLAYKNAHRYRQTG